MQYSKLLPLPPEAMADPKTLAKYAPVNPTASHLTNALEKSFLTSLFLYSSKEFEVGLIAALLIKMSYVPNQYHCCLTDTDWKLHP